MIDVSRATHVSEEFRGINKKEWLFVKHRKALFKETQIKPNGEHTNAHYSEALVSKICKLIGFPCAEVEIAKKDGKIGCVSYSFLKDGEELIDFISLIQNIEKDFDSKKLMTKTTKRNFSIPLIIESIEAECKSSKNCAKGIKQLISICIIDSLIEHYDRNPSNIAAIKHNKEIKMAPLFDNGTSLNLALPKEVVQRYLKTPDGISKSREKVLSKVGVEGKSFITFDLLEDYILNYYFQEATDIIEKIIEEFNIKEVEKILQGEDYKDLDETYKQFILIKLQFNKDKLALKYEKAKRKNEFEDSLKSKDMIKKLTKISKKSPNSKLEKDILNAVNQNPNMFDKILNIEENLEKENIILKPLNENEKRLLRWIGIFNNSGQNIGEINETMEELGFYIKDIETINLLMFLKNKELPQNTQDIKEMISGKDGINKDNLNVLLYLKFIEAISQEKNTQKKEKLISELKEFQEKCDDVLIKIEAETKMNLLVNKSLKNKLSSQKEVAKFKNKLLEFLIQNPKANDEQIESQIGMIINEVRYSSKQNGNRHEEKASKLQSSIEENKELKELEAGLLDLSKGKEDIRNTDENN